MRGDPVKELLFALAVLTILWMAGSFKEPPRGV